MSDPEVYDEAAIMQSNGCKKRNMANFLALRDIFVAFVFMIYIIYKKVHVATFRDDSYQNN
jgi:hypothetical protein